MIQLRLSEENLEYDIRGLLTSFFPGEEIRSRYGAPETETCELGEKDKAFSVDDAGNAFSVCFSDGAGFCRKLDLPADRPTRPERKAILKRAVYDLLSAYCGKGLPWGTLTGIRPTKIAMSLLEEGKEDDAIVSHMRDYYLVSEKKAALSLEIARREREILKNIDYDNGYSLYIGIPFCPTTCLYCSFTSYPVKKWEKRMDEYLDAVFAEMELTAKLFEGKKLNTVYVGGGTPTTLSAEQMDRLLTKVEETFDFTDLQEFTVEAGRPDSITKEKLAAIRKHKVDRISINPQTMKQETLDLVGRRHTVEDIRRIFHLARELGFDNINMDLILGLPGETYEDVCHTMEELKALGPDNITLHSLAIKRAARLNLQWEKYKNLLMENSEEVMAMTENACREMGLVPYYLYRQKNMAGNFENTGYAAEGKAGIYNILIMEEKQSICALGAGSTSKAVWPDGRIERADNVKDVDEYLKRIPEMLERKVTLYSELLGREKQEGKTDGIE